MEVSAESIPKIYRTSIENCNLFLKERDIVAVGLRFGSCNYIPAVFFFLNLFSFEFSSRLKLVTLSRQSSGLSCMHRLRQWLLMSRNVTNFRFFFHVDGSEWEIFNGLWS